MAKIKDYGWGGPELAREQFDIIGESFHKFFIAAQTKPTQQSEMMLWRYIRQVHGKDADQIAQEIGDCVSWGARRAIITLMATEIAMGDREKWVDVFAPYLYGTGRVQIGGGRLDGGDGSLGSWQAKAVMEYGTISVDMEGVPKYNGSVATKWGNRPGPPKEFLEKGREHIVKSAAQITSWTQLVDAIKNGYPVTVASDQGFEMKARADGFHYPRGQWMHQMCITGVDDAWKDPYGCIQNSWPKDSHGEIRDFNNPDEVWPACSLRVRAEVIEKMLRQGDSFAFSGLNGFPERLLPRSAFDIV